MLSDGLYCIVQNRLCVEARGVNLVLNVLPLTTFSLHIKFDSMKSAIVCFTRRYHNVISKHQLPTELLLGVNSLFS